LYNAKTWTLQKVVLKSSLKVLKYDAVGRMEKISWIYGLKNEILQRVKWKGTSCKQRNEGRLNGFVISYVGSAF
jgi:hypothetical protein